MALPAGFKVNGLMADTRPNSIRVRAAVQKVLDFLDKLPFKELLDTNEVWIQTSVDPSQHSFYIPAVGSYKLKVDGKLVWGSPKTIAELRRQLNEPEETNDEN